MKTKIVHIITALSVGGAEQALYKLLLNTDNSKYTTTVVSLTSVGMKAKKIKRLGVDVYSCNMNKGIHGVLGLYVLVKVLRKVRPDIVQTWLYHSDLIGGIIAKTLGIKNIIWGIRTTDIKSTSIVTYIVRFICAKLSRSIPEKIIVVAESSKNKHVELGYYEPKMLVIPNGFEYRNASSKFQDIQLIKSKLHINKKDFVIGAVGRFSYDKGHDVLIQASKEILKKFPNVKFLLVGPGLELSNKKVVSIIKKNSDLSRFLLVGEQSNINSYLQMMNIFCLPSRTEGFPNILGEAMLLGVPCVATNVGDVSILGGNEVLLSKAGSSEDLSRKIVEMMSFAESTRNQIGLILQNRIIENYPISNTVIKHHLLYQELLKEEL